MKCTDYYLPSQHPLKHKKCVIHTVSRNELCLYRKRNSPREMDEEDDSRDILKALQKHSDPIIIPD